MGFNYKTPMPEEICAYIEYLTEKNPNPKGIRGSISSLKTFFKIANLHVKTFESQLVQNALRAIDITLKHKPKHKEAIDPSTIARVLKIIDKRPHGYMVSFAIALMFTALLRQSNILCKTIRTFDKERQVLCKNVRLNNNKVLEIDLLWSKTNQRFGESTIVTASNMPNSIICPITRYNQTQPIADRNSMLPLIRFTDSNPMTINFVYQYWKEALYELKIHKPHMTLHRLRLSGASWASKSGVPPLAICQQGTWQTESYRSYIMNDNTTPSKVNEAMSNIRDQNEVEFGE